MESRSWIWLPLVSWVCRSVPLLAGEALVVRVPSDTIRIEFCLVSGHRRPYTPARQATSGHEANDQAARTDAAWALRNEFGKCCCRATGTAVRRRLVLDNALDDVCERFGSASIGRAANVGRDAGLVFPCFLPGRTSA